MNDTINIEKALFPSANELIKSDDGLSAYIVDVELDPIELDFYGDGTVHINTENITYMVFDRANLNTLRRLLDRAELYLSEQD